MKLKSAIIFILALFMLSGCITKSTQVEPGFKTITTRGYGNVRNAGGSAVANSAIANSAVSNVYNASLQVSGDLSFIDRKYFLSTITTKLEDKGINIEYNSVNRIDIKITQNIINSRSSGGDSYQNCSAFKLDRKVMGAIEYIIRGKTIYANSINYKFLVKSSSCISYDDAERKARLLLIKKLARLVALRIVRYKNILYSANMASCAR